MLPLGLFVRLKYKLTKICFVAEKCSVCYLSSLPSATRVAIHNTDHRPIHPPCSGLLQVLVLRMYDKI